MELISVIVPVYKVEAYLDKCISSIVNQTYQNLEIILVDDGSPDRSGEICDAWAAKDSRIKVIHQKNAGGGAARNAALDTAKGQLIAFVDSDDYIAPDMYGHLHGLLQQGADIAECGYRNVWNDDVVFENSVPEIQTYTVEEAMELHLRGTAFRQLIWNKLYRRETVGDIRFPIGKKIDDEFFTYQVLGNAKKLIRSDKICYAYRQQGESVMHSMDAAGRLEGVEAKVLRHDYIEEKFSRLAPASLQDLWYACLFQGQLSLREMEKVEAALVLTYLREVLLQRPAALKDYRMKEKLWFSMADKSLETACRLRNFLRIGL